MKAHRSVLAALVAAFGGLAGAVEVRAGGVACAVVDPQWRAGHQTTEDNLLEALDGYAEVVAEERTATMEQIVSAVRVITQQESLEGSREAEFASATAQAVAQTYAQQRAAEAIRSAHHLYGPQGQAVGGCEAQERFAGTGAVLATLPDRASEILASGGIDAVPGSGVGPLEATGRRLDRDEPEAVSAVAFLDPETPPELRDAFIDNLAGPPPLKPQGLETDADRLLFMQARRQEALRSPALVSLAAVRAAHEEPDDAGPDAGGDSLGTRIEEVIAVYGGGALHEEWQAALVTKSETGLVKEIARLRAMTLALQNAREGSGARRQAMIGALLAAETVGP